MINSLNVIQLKNVPAIIAWLQILLFERFGHNFGLTWSKDGFTFLSVDDDIRGIRIKSDLGIFGQINLPCGEWHAEAEGWRGALLPSLPAPGVSTLTEPLIEQSPSGFTINYDILGLAYWMLSRAEEIGRNDLDEHGRFPATASHAYKHGYLERPVVDEWLAILGQVINRQWPMLQLKQHHFSMKVSHDVDIPSRYGFRTVKGLLRAMGGDIVKQRYTDAMRAPWIRLKTGTELHPADPYNTFDWIMDASERHGLKSAFYFLCGRTDAAKDADYEPEHPAIRHLMRRIHVRGHEVGLHPSYGSYQSPRIVAAEAARLHRVAREEAIHQTEWGGRMHYLRWQHPTTLQAWENAGMDYDSTLCYADRPGFRCGTCFEYPAFEPVEGKCLRLRIRPLIAMECTVIDSRYMGLGTGNIALQKFEQLKNACKSVNGCFTLLWHNSQLAARVEKDLYEALIKN